MAEDDTQELLKKYGVDGYKDSPGYNDDELSLYSEDSIFKENFSQLRMSSPIKVKQTPRKTLFTPRLPKSSIYSPEKERNPYDTNTRSPLRNNMNSVSDISMNQDLQNFMNKSVLGFEDKDEDKTELLIKETHKAINAIPKSVLENKDMEEYQKLITASIQKLAGKCESLSIENEALKNNDDKVIIQQLQHKINTLTKSNDMFKQEVSKQSDEFMSMLNENNDLKRENELLRTKLIKYKNLYETKEKHRDNVNSKNKKKEVRNDSVNANKLIQLYNEMAEILDKDKKSSNKPLKQSYNQDTTEIQQQQDDFDPDLLKKFENIIKENKVQDSQPPQSENSQEDIINKALLKNNKLYEKLIHVLDSKQKNETTIQETSPAHKEESNEKQDVVLQCYLCCQNLHNNHGTTNEVRSNPSSAGSNGGSDRRKCERCSSVSSKNSKRYQNYNNADHIQRNTSGFGIDLMGEYKWTI